jgi:hypothetical protein
MTRYGSSGPIAEKRAPSVDVLPIADGMQVEAVTC